MNRQDAESAKRVEPAEELDRLAHEVIGAAIEVHRELGPGFLESVYENAWCIELTSRGIPFTRQSPIGVEYKGHVVGEGRADMIVAGSLIVELKSSDGLAPIHTAQLMSYLKSAHCQLGLLINFNVAVLKKGLKRVIHN